MSNQTTFIKKAFEIIKNEFPEIDTKELVLDIYDVDNMKEDVTPAYIEHNMHYDQTGKQCLYDSKICIINDFEYYKNKIPSKYELDIDTAKEIMDSFKIQESEKLIIICCLLHEFGHYAHLKESLKYNDEYSTYFSLQTINEEFTRVAFNVSRYDYNVGDHIYYTFMFNEIYAEMFKFKYFYRIWNKIKFNVREDEKDDN